MSNREIKPKAPDFDEILESCDMRKLSDEQAIELVVSGTEEKCMFDLLKEKHDNFS